MWTTLFLINLIGFAKRETKQTQTESLFKAVLYKPTITIPALLQLKINCTRKSSLFFVFRRSKRRQQRFFYHEQQKSSTSMSSTHKVAKLLFPTKSGFQQAGEELRAGKLVAFPTETVYGLGANAFDQKAVLSIFEAKGRPLTDPLIVHVPSIQEAVKLVDLTPKGQIVFEELGKAFWPGPLTLISKAVATLPLTVSANTGFVGIRCPSHPIAQALLREANVPIAAPSANRFGHVSPTSAQHVMDDLGQNEISIIDDTNETTCQVGIESTVIKIVPEEKKLILFRRGGISEKALFNFLKEKKTLFDGLFSIQIIDKKQAKKKEEQEPQQAPGQLLTHYAPDVDTYLYQSNSSSSSSLFFLEEDKDKLVILDFHGRLFHLKKKVLAYQDLSISGDIIEASKKIFDFLRWAENIQGVERILLTDVLDVDHEHTNALHDRMYRAASGKVL